MAEEGDQTPEGETLDPMNIIVGWVRDTDYAKTNRQEIIGVVVKDRLNDGLKEHLADPGMTSAVNLLTNQVSTWVDERATDVEKDLKPAKPEKKTFTSQDNVIFYVKKRNEKSYCVEPVSTLEGKPVVEEDPSEPMICEDVEEFTKWVEKLIILGDAWSKWVEKSFCEAYVMFNRSKSQLDQPSTSEFKQWKDDKRVEALQWKRVQKYIYGRGSFWERWAKFTKLQLPGEHSDTSLLTQN